MHFLYFHNIIEQEVKILCFSNDSIEKRIYEVSERIQKQSIYSVIRIEYIGGESLTLKNEHESEGVNLIADSKMPIISKIFLKDDNDNHYKIRPTSNGLSFAEGKLTYTEYKILERKEELNGYGIFTLILSTFLLASWVLVRFFF